MTLSVVLRRAHGTQDVQLFVGAFAKMKALFGDSPQHARRIDMHAKQLRELEKKQR